MRLSISLFISLPPFLSFSLPNSLFGIIILLSITVWRRSREERVTKRERESKRARERAREEWEPTSCCFYRSLDYGNHGRGPCSTPQLPKRELQWLGSSDVFLSPLPSPTALFISLARHQGSASDGSGRKSVSYKRSLSDLR